jgi:hypothetical protein
MELISYAASGTKLRQLLEAIRACARSMRGDASTHTATHALVAATPTRGYAIWVPFPYQSLLVLCVPLGQICQTLGQSLGEVNGLRLLEAQVQWSGDPKAVRSTSIDGVEMRFYPRGIAVTT